MTQTTPKDIKRHILSPKKPIKNSSARVHKNGLFEKETGHHFLILLWTQVIGTTVLENKSSPKSDKSAYSPDHIQLSFKVKLVNKNPMSNQLLN